MAQRSTFLSLKRQYSCGLSNSRRWRQQVRNSLPLLLAIPTAVLRRGGLFPAGYLVTGETSHPNFPTADFALVRDTAGNLVPRLVEGQAFPSIYGYQSVLCSGYRDVFGLDKDLRVFLGGTEEEEYWALLARTIIAGHDPENVVLTELDPLHQKTSPTLR